MALALPARPRSAGGAAPATKTKESTPGPHLPQLDGIRALAISAVVAYHLGYLPGGWLGVDVFFVLSGYLITWILLSKGGPAHRLGWFWGRRARRLLPAVIALVAVVSLYAWSGGPGLVPAQIRAPALATLFYTANWQQIVAGHSYFARYLQPNPFQHAWSLAIEEQYYLLWPLILGALLVIFPRADPGRRGRPRRPVILTTVLLAIASAAWMGVAAHLFGPNRAYLGTDTRAWELLLGGAAAMLWPPRRSPAGPEVQEAQRAQEAQDQRSRGPATALVLGAAGVVAGIAAAGGPPAWVWDGGLVAVALCSTAVIVGSVHAGGSPLARTLGSGPVAWLGLISYSLYLWHWPAIVLISSGSTGLSGAALLTVRLAAMLAAACASYYLVERPLRRLDWRRLGTRPRVRVPAPAFAAVAVAAAAALVAAGTAGPARAPSAPVTTVLFPGPTAAERQQHLDLPPAQPGRPYRVWIIGDSVMFDSSLGVTAALQSTGEMTVVADNAFPGWSPRLDRQWGLQASHIIATEHPQIVLGTWSWDDPEAAADPVAYLHFLDAMLRTLLAPGDGVEAVVLFQFPQAGPPTSQAGAAGTAAWRSQTDMQTAWNDVARQATSAFPGHAIYLTTDRAFDPGGRYYTWFRTAGGAWLRARKMDDVHMCPYGAALFGALAEGDLSYYLHLPPVQPGWATGSWTHDPRYDDPPGACPDDRPPPGYDGVPVP